MPESPSESRRMIGRASICLLLVGLFAAASCRPATTSAGASPVHGEHPSSGLRLSAMAAGLVPGADRSADGQWHNEWTRGAVVYQLFVRSFYDSNGDGVGDLEGVIAKLDYLNDGDRKTSEDLAVDAIWLMPIFPSPSSHGYDVTDFDRINPQYGTLEDFDRLVREAHARGMRVILDFVVNHTSSKHPWFEQSASSPSSPYRDWYVWSPSRLSWIQPWEGGNDATWHERNGSYYYAAFWGGMPDLNLRNPAVRQAIMQSAERWLRRGVDGLRLDGVRYAIETGPDAGQRDTPETHAFWREFAAFVRQVKPTATLIGESWVSDPAGVAAYYGASGKVRGGDELCLNLNFPLAEAVRDALVDGKAAQVVDTLRRMQRIYPPDAADAPFVGNHDLPRLASLVGGDRARLRLAAALLLTLPGAAVMYYGDELGLFDSRPGKEDQAQRAPLPWSPAPHGGFTAGRPWYPLARGWEQRNVELEHQDSTSLLSWYRKLIGIRAAHRALRDGKLSLIDGGAAARSIVAYLVERGSERVLVALNFSTKGAAELPLPASVAAFDPIVGYPTAAQPKRDGDGWRLTVAPAGVQIFQLSTPQ